MDSAQSFRAIKKPENAAIKNMKGLLLLGLSGRKKENVPPRFKGEKKV